MDSSVYRRPNKPFRCTMNIVPEKVIVDSVDIEKPIILHRSSECHVTPDNLADIMAQRAVAAVGTDGNFLEPQCGTGNLVKAMLRHGVELDRITGVEREQSLVSALRGNIPLLRVENDDFLEWKSTLKYDAILTNPPFRYLRHHIKRAMELRSNNGIIVALVPVTFDMPGWKTVYHCNTDDFALVKVRTKIVEFC
ncbi:TPA: hypothetical protein I7682_18095 [Vibrio vulnificus]|nr:hypothetical protein [Vibrio vulnificus]